MTEAIAIAAKAEEVLDVDVKDVYRQVAKTYGSTPSFVNKAIQQAFEAAWMRNPELPQFFGYGDDQTKRPTNAEVIVLLADKVQLTKLCEDAEN